MYGTKPKPISTLDQLAERKADYLERTGIDVEQLDQNANWGGGLDDEGLLLLSVDLIRRRCERDADKRVRAVERRAANAVK
jgi:hypothetical protein